MALKDAAGWNQTPQDWRNLLSLAPEGSFGLECDGRLAATTTAVSFGRRLAWIGMVLTHPDYRGRGFARRLMEHALESLRQRGVEWIQLDATDMGRPLYRQLGFEDECPIERWARIGGTRELPGAPGGARPREPAPVAAAAALDCGAFGADRSELLSLLAAGDSADLPGEGFAMGRPGSRAAYFGPCVARSPEAARTLLEWFLARRQGETVYWDLLPGNPAAIRLARAAGFEPLRRLVRMARPGRARQPPDEPLRRRDSDVFAIAGFEYG